VEKHMTQNTDKTCCLPWNHLATHPNGYVGLCCQSDNTDGMSYAKTASHVLNLGDSSVIQIINSDYYKQTRLEMLNGIEPQACTRCYESERNGGWSKRIYENENFAWQGQEHAKSITKDDGEIVVAENLEFIELRLGNVCNLKCISCNSVSSSKWASDEAELSKRISWLTPLEDSKQTPWFSSTEFYRVLAEFGPKLKSIYINGGEPLLVKEHKILLRNLVASGFSKNINLQYSTNLTITDAEILTLWSNFKKVHLMLSIDDLRERNDIIRFPSKWEQIDTNLNWYIANASMENISLTICQTISAMNAEYVLEFNRWCNTKNIHHTLNFVHYPVHLSAQAITPEYRKKILEKNADLHEGMMNQLLAWFEACKYDEVQKDRFVEYCNELDNVRKTNAMTTFGILRSYTAISKSFCIFPWTHFFVTPDEKVMPCCTADNDIPFGDLKKNSVIEIWNGDNYRQLRKDMINGVWNKACAACEKHEHSDDAHSFRHWANDKFKNYFSDVKEMADDYSTPMKMRYLDFRWNNTCNLKCRTCGDLYSSQWGVEQLKYKKTTIIKAAQKVSKADELMQMVRDHALELDTLYFAGGEPLLVEQQYELVNLLVENGQSKNINLSYTLNATIWNSKVENLIEQWKHFKSVSIQFSIDHIGEKATFIRHPLVWSEVEKNIDKFIERCEPSVSFNSNTVVSVLNIFDLSEVIEYIQARWNGRVMPLSMMKLVIPEEFDARNLPIVLKKQLMSKIIDCANHLGEHNVSFNMLHDVAAFLITDGPFSDSFETFQQKLVHKLWVTDGHRQEDFRLALPELAEVLS
jgi:MoaA/NifB/PqqE/SkfB family radical SAM enzyme